MTFPNSSEARRRGAHEGAAGSTISIAASRTFDEIEKQSCRLGNVGHAFVVGGVNHVDQIAFEGGSDAAEREVRFHV